MRTPRQPLRYLTQILSTNLPRHSHNLNVILFTQLRPILPHRNIGHRRAHRLKTYLNPRRLTRLLLIHILKIRMLNSHMTTTVSLLRGPFRQKIHRLHSNIHQQRKHRTTHGLINDALRRLIVLNALNLNTRHLTGSILRTTRILNI